MRQAPCCDCARLFRQVTVLQVRCKPCQAAQERAKQRARNARRTFHRCKDCRRQVAVNTNRLCQHCSQHGDIPAAVIEARYQAARAWQRWARRQAA